jgi:hypothetical protein
MPKGTMSLASRGHFDDFKTTMEPDIESLPSLHITQYQLIEEENLNEASTNNSDGDACMRSADFDIPVRAGRDWRNR